MAEVLICINKLLPRMQNMILIAEKLERTCSANNKNEIQTLKEGLIENKQQVEQIGELTAEVFEHSLQERQRLEEMVNNITSDNEHAQKRLAELEGEIFKLDGKIEKLEDDLQNERKEVETLQLGQIGTDFERDLALYVYPYGKKIGSDQIFTRMKEWLEKKKETPQGREANEKWKRLKQR